MTNEIFSEEQLQKIKETENFLKEAFCIDGKCSYIEDVRINSALKNTVGMLYILNDTNRGMFFVIIGK